VKTAADIRQSLLALAEPVCADNGYELVDVEYTRGPSGWIARFYIDRRPDLPPASKGGISFEDCERLSRQLGAMLDVEDPVPTAYSLEVSSPGLDRPLRTAAHFQRYLGETAKVTLSEPLAGRRNFKGVLRTVEPLGAEPGEPGEGAESGQTTVPTVTVVMDVDGNEFRLPLADIASARLVPDWDTLMKRGSADRGEPGQPNRGIR
jgi:ribosome maturation factor RimP